MERAYTIEAVGGSVEVSETRGRQTVRLTICGANEISVELGPAECEDLKRILPGYVGTYTSAAVALECERKPQEEAA